MDIILYLILIILTYDNQNIDYTDSVKKEEKLISIYNTTIQNSSIILTSEVHKPLGLLSYPHIYVCIINNYEIFEL